MAVPQTTQTRYMDGGVQAIQGVGGLHKINNPIPTSFFEWNVYLSFAVKLLETALCW